MRPAPLLDIVAIMLFALFARIAHPPFTFTGLLAAFWPWAVGALLGWVFITSIKASPGRWVEGAIVWCSTIVGGMILWSIVNTQLPHYTFLLVASIMSALLMFGWRAIAAFRARRAEVAEINAQRAQRARTRTATRPPRR